MVSIIIPVFNGKKYIETVLQSCLNQTYQNIEIILIDDGSTDGLVLPIKYKKNKKIRFYSKSNEGLGKTRNFGIEKSQGQYIFFLDVDDTIPQSAIELLVSNIGQNDIAIGKCERVFYNKNNHIYKKEIWKENIYKKLENKYDLIVDNIATNKLYKKYFLIENKLLFLEGLYEDKLFVLKVISNMSNYVFVDEVVYFWRVEYNSTSISNQLTIDNLTARMEVINECINYTQDNKLVSKIVENTIKHDLKIYVNNSYKYSYRELTQLYAIYAKFIKKYKVYINKITFKKNKKIIKNILDKYLTINEFLYISHNKNAFKIDYCLTKSIIFKIFLKLKIFRKEI